VQNPPMGIVVSKGGKKRRRFGGSCCGSGGGGVAAWENGGQVWKERCRLAGLV
jgi:hypothetical protein